MYLLDEYMDLDETDKITEQTESKKSKGKLILILALTAVLAIGSGLGFFFIWRSANYITTDNARVTTTLVAVTPSVPGILQRFTIYEGRHVAENEILGWVEHGEVMRSPLSGLVIHTNAVQDQAVSPAEPVAVIADTADIHIQANIEETYTARIHAGQRVIVTIDPFGRRQFSGYVRELGHVTAAELAGTAMFFNTGGTFTRVTHLIPVKINIVDDVDLASLIGVNARVRISMRNRDDREQHTSPALIRPTIPTGAAQHTANITVRGLVESTERRRVYSTLGFFFV
jgi:multidrug resistance efflux pump